MGPTSRAVEAAQKVEGWMSPSELTWLADTASRMKRIIEVGSWMGRSTTAMALTTPGIILCVDSWQRGADPGKPQERSADDVYRTFLKNLGPHIVSGKVIALRMTSANAARALKDLLGNQRADMIFIDGDHNAKAVSEDIANYLPLLDPKGLLCGHDFQHPPLRDAVTRRFPGVTAAPRTTIWTVPQRK